MLHYVVFWDILLLNEVGLPVPMPTAMVMLMLMSMPVAMSMSTLVVVTAMSTMMVTRTAISSEPSARDFLESIFY